MSLGEGGFQYLIAGARANVGVKAGRYAFEASMLEALNMAEPQASVGRTPMPRNLLRIGLTVAQSSLFLNEGEGVCFDSEGYFASEGRRIKVGPRIERGQIVSLVVNLGTGLNANTVSLFLDGDPIAYPQPIPESMRGKVLYPTIAYKNVTLHVNFGPAKATLPFVCRMMQDASAEDVEVAPPMDQTEGKCNIVFPVGLPDTGIFDWANDFLEKHPGYIELSDRMIQDWAVKSGLYRSKEQSSNDKPEMNFGIPLMDDMSVSQVLSKLAPALRRNFLFLELRANLVASERSDTLRRFGSGFHRVARVMMGEPSASYKEVVRTLILADKAADLEAERERRRIEAGPRKDTEVSTESKVADAEVEVQDTLALTEEEEKMCVRKSEVPDLTSSALSRSFASFALPTAEEGFEEIAYEWQPMEQCKALLKEWVSARKLTTRVEDLQPSQWFKNHWQTWQKLNGEWRKLQGDWKDPVKRKALLQRKLDAKRKEAGADPEAELMKIDAESIDIHTVADVTDIGSGEPLFANFVFEDWTLLSTHVELHLLLHAFRKDLNDPERLSFHESHLAFYYSRYYRKPFELKYFGVETLVDFVEMVSETMKVRDDGMLEAILGEDAPLDGFLRHTEAYRRERQHRIDAGDESARLKFSKPVPPRPRQQMQAQALRQQQQAHLQLPLDQPPSMYGPRGGFFSNGNPQKRPAPPQAPAQTPAKRPAYDGSAYGSVYTPS